MAINITVKFTIHLEHTNEASLFTPALVVWSRLNISFQQICINLHRPYTVHKLWKGLFFQLHFLCNSPNTARLPATKYNNIQLPQIFYIHQCLIQEKQIWLLFKSIHSSLQHLRWWTQGSQDRSFFLRYCVAKIKICETALQCQGFILPWPSPPPHGIKWISPLNSYC